MRDPVKLQDIGLLTYLGETLAEYADDEQTFWDTMDGETDIMDVVRELLDEDAKCKANCDYIKNHIQELKNRQARFEARANSVRKALKSIMLATGQEKIPHPLATITLRAGTQSVNITDEKEVPTQLTKTVTSPDKAAIKRLLMAGEQIDGAELVTGPKTVSIRTR